MARSVSTAPPRPSAFHLYSSRADPSRSENRTASAPSSHRTKPRTVSRRWLFRRSALSRLCVDFSEPTALSLAVEFLINLPVRSLGEATETIAISIGVR